MSYSNKRATVAVPEVAGGIRNLCGRQAIHGQATQGLGSQHASLGVVSVPKTAGLLQVNDVLAVAQSSKHR